MFHDTSLTGGTDALLRQIGAASAAQRLHLQPELARMVESMERAGMPVPAQVRSLNDQLLDEAIEARFDNLPV